MRAAILAVALFGSVPAYAQAPAAGSGNGGPVGASISNPTAPTGKTPPGTPGGQTTADGAARDSAGAAVIGKTTTLPGPVVGNTAGQDSGVHK